MWLIELLKNAIKTKNNLYLKGLKIDTAANEIQYKNTEISYITFWGVLKEYTSRTS